MKTLLLITGLLSALSARAEGFPETNCVASGNGYFLERVDGGSIGFVPFAHQAECELARQSSAAGIVCQAVDGHLTIPHSLKSKRLVGDFYFNDVTQCASALQGMKEDLVCVPAGRDGNFMVFDVLQDAPVSRLNSLGLTACQKELPKFQDAAKRAAFPPNAVKDCGPVDMTGPGGSMEHVAIRAQGAQPICFAEAAAQVVDAWRFTHQDTDYSFQTSGLVAALQTYQRSGQVELEGGGWVKEAIETIKTNKACSLAATLETKDSQMVDDIVALLKTARNDKKFDELKQLGTSPYCLPPGQFLPDTEQLIRLAQDSDPQRLFSRALVVPCQGKNLKAAPKIGLIPLLDVVASPPLEISQRLSAQIKNPGSMPVPLDFCANLLKDRGYRASFSRSGPDTRCSEGQHAVLVVGKRPNPQNGRCEFLIRNSYGPDCGRGKQAGLAWDCDGRGNTWIDAEALSRSAYHLYQVKKK